MDAKEAIKINLECADMVCGAYLNDLTDDEAMQRPHAGCNHINWQLGHLIAADNMMCNDCFPGSLPALPDGFAEKYSKETAGSDSASDFVSKSELMALHKEQRKAITAVLMGLSEEQLEGDAPERFKAMAPSVGAVFSLLGSHWLMHAGQWVIVRRNLGREIVI